MGLFTIFWETFEEYLFPNAPALKERRQLKRLDRQLRRTGVLARSGSTLGARWTRAHEDLNQALAPFRPLFQKTFGSPQADYRQALSRRFWEESLGSEFLEKRSHLTAEVLKRRFVQHGNDVGERQTIERDITQILDIPGKLDPLPLTQEWNALYWFSELVLFPMETVLQPWSGTGKRTRLPAGNIDPTTMGSALEDLYLVLGAIDPGKNLERAIVRFYSMYVQDEAQISKVYLQIQKVRALMFGPCHFSGLRDLIRWTKGNSETQPLVGRQDPQWFRRSLESFEGCVRSDLDKALAEAFQAWMDKETTVLLGGQPLLEITGYGEAENTYLRKTKNPVFSLVRPLALFKTFFFGQVKLAVIPVFRAILLKATFVDKELNKSLTQWVYRMESVESDWQVFETGLADGLVDSWSHFHEVLETATHKNTSTTQRTVERVNDRVLSFLTERTQEIINLLETGVLLATDRQQGGGAIQNWQELGNLEKGTQDTLGTLPVQSKLFFKLMKSFLPVQSTLLE